MFVNDFWLAYAGLVVFCLVIIIFSVLYRLYRRPVQLEKEIKILAILRTVYATPTLKEAIETQTGLSLGFVPPVSPFIQQIFGHDSHTNFPKVFRRRMHKIRLWLSFCIVCMLVALFTIPSAMMLAFDISLILGMFWLYLAGWFCQENEMYNCVCCKCGLTTCQLHQEDEMLDTTAPNQAKTFQQEHCTNCHGTAICRLGCCGCAGSLVVGPRATVVNTGVDSSELSNTTKALGHVRSDCVVLKKALVLDTI